MSELLMGTTNSSSSSGGSMFANASQHQEQQHQQLHHDYHHHPHHHHHQEQQQQQLQQSQQQLTQQLGSHLEQDGAAYSVPTIAEGEMDIVNVTREYPFEYAVVMFGYLLPVVLIVIIVTNLLVVAVLSQRHMRTPTNIVLLTMAIVDMATSLSPSPWYLYIYTFGNYEKFLYPPVACYAHHIMTDVVPIFFHVSSTWLALLLASQRYIYVCHPTLARTWCTVPRVKRAIMVILAVAFLHQLTRFFDNKFISVEIEVNHVKHMACKNEVADWVQAINDRTYVIIYFTIRIVFVFIIPCSALIILNWLLLRALKRAETKRTQLLRTKFKIVDVDPSQAGGERNSHQNLSVAAFGIVRDASSYFMGGSSGPGSGPPPRRPLGGVSGAGSSGGGASCLRIGQRGTLMGDRMMGNEEEEEEEEEDDEEDAEKNAPLTKGSLTLSSATPTRLINQTLVQRRPSEAGDLLTGDGQDIDNNNNISRHKKSMLDKTIGGGDDDDRGRLASANATAAAAPAVTTAAAATGSIVRGESLRSGSSASSNNDSVGPPGGSSNHSVSSTSKTDDISTCPECAAYEIEMRRGGCRRCSGSIEGQGLATSTTIASCEHHRSNCHRHLLHHQPISQCSSILGGVTNTTTNEEDISSCLVTQNISSSMFVPTTLDGIETSSMRGADDDDADDDDDGDNGHRDCDNNDHRVTHDDNDGELPLMADCDVAGETGPKDTREGDHQERLRRRQQLSRAGCGGGAPRLAQFRADSDLGQLIQSGSVDSRLACDCTTAKAVTLSRARSLGKQKQGRLSSCGVGSGCKIGGRSCSALDNSSSAQLSGGNQQQQQVMDSTTIGYRGPNHAAVTSNNSDLVSGTVTGGGQRACDMFVGGRTPAPATTTTNGAAGTEQLVAHLNKSASLMLRAAARADSDSSIMGQQSRSGCGVEQQIVDSTTELPVEGSGANRLSSQPPTANSTTNNNNGAASFQPATATTTLYSANTSSASSLLQVELQVGSGLCKQASPAQTGFGGGGAPAGSGGGGPNGRSPATTTTTTRRQSGGSSKPMMMTRSDHQLTAISGGNGQSHMAPQQHRTIKSPSFASCTTGRGSRATLLGTATSNNNNNNSGNGLPMIVSSGHRHHHNNHQHHHNSNNIQATIPASATRSMDSNRTTLMLVVVVTVFLIAEVPVGIVTATHVVVNLSDIFKDFEFDGFNEWVSYIRLFTNFLVMISYSVNFTIYCSMSKRFRETFRDLFWCGRQGRRKRSKRIFSQSQAPHCTQTTNPHQFAASTVMTSAANHNNNINGNHAHGHQNNNNNHYQGLVASNSNQTLLSHMPPRRPSERLGQQSECEL